MSNSEQIVGAFRREQLTRGNPGSDDTVTFGQAPLFGKCSECGAIISMVDAQYAGDSALAEHARILRETFRQHVGEKHCAESGSKPHYKS
jgi:hypothetical protein